MIADDRRRSRLLGLRIRVQQSEIEHVRTSVQAARETCRRTSDSLSQARTAVESAESGLRHSLSASASLDPRRLEDSAKYLEDQGRVHRQRLFAHERADQSLRQSVDKLEYAARVLKALEGVKQTADRQVLVEEDKRQAAVAEELWLQRWGRGK